MKGQDMQGQDDKIKEFFERARKGVLKHLDAKGGLLTLGALHDYSLNTYLIQHQRFSIMMESFVSEGLATYDNSTDEVLITDKGREFIK
jgi:hypothetical protein